MAKKAEVVVPEVQPTIPGEGEVLEPEPTENTELVQLRSQIQKLDANWKNEQRISSKKEDDLRQLREDLARLQSDKETSQALIAMIANQQGRSEEDVVEDLQSRKPDLREQFKQIQSEAEARRVGEQFRQRVEALGLTENDDVYWGIHDHVVSGNPERLKAANTKLKKLEQEKLETANKGDKVMPTETEEQRIERLAEEKAEAKADEKLRQEMEKRGLLTSDTGGPSAVGRSFAEKEQAYSEGTLSLEEYSKARREAGL